MNSACFVLLLLVALVNYPDRGEAASPLDAVGGLCGGLGGGLGGSLGGGVGGGAGGDLSTALKTDVVAKPVNDVLTKVGVSQCPKTVKVSKYIGKCVPAELKCVGISVFDETTNTLVNIPPCDANGHPIPWSQVKAGAEHSNRVEVNADASAKQRVSVNPQVALKTGASANQQLDARSSYA